MIDTQTLTALLITLGLLPLIWSMVMTVLRAAVERDATPPGDREEKLTLAAMLAPIAIGLILLLFARLAPDTASLPLPLLDPGHFQFSGAIAAASAEPAASIVDWLPLGLGLIASFYVIGLAVALCSLARATLHMRLTIRAARPTDASHDIAIADTDLPPFATAGGVVILPSTLVTSAPQPHLDMIIAHERAHISRGDPRYYLILSAIEAVLWFNPFVRAQTARCRLAAELACDHEVVAQFFEQAPEMRRTYAQAIVSALKHAAGNALPCAPAAFSTRKHGEYRMRIANIMQAQASPRKQRTAFTIAALIAAAPIACAQLAYAFDAPDETPAFSSAMVDGKVSSSYGQRKDPFSDELRFHNGVDIAAADGTTINAPAAGTVTRYELGLDGYGNMLEIDHGDGYVTRYGQLKSSAVAPGDKVRAGQKIAEVGSSGRATGPHLHVELYKDGETVDPASVLILPAKKN